MSSTPRDENREPGLIAKSDADNTPIVLEADPATKRLKANVTITGGMGLITSAYDYVAMTNADGGGNYQTITYKTGGSGGITVATLTMTFDGANNVTSITRT